MVALQLSQAIVVSHPVWYDRAWVLHEFALARKASVLWSRGSIEYGYITFIHLSINAGAHRLAPATAILCEKLNSLANVTASDQSLLHVMKLAGYMDASVPRDRVFALLGLVQPTQASMIIPDYSCSTGQVYTRVTFACIESQRDASVLRLAVARPGRQKDLPIWAIDFSMPLVMDRSTWVAGLSVVEPLVPDNHYCRYDATVRSLLIRGVNLPKELLRFNGVTFWQPEGDSKLVAVRPLKRRDMSQWTSVLGLSPIPGGSYELRDVMTSPDLDLNLRHNLSAGTEEVFALI